MGKPMSYEKAEKKVGMKHHPNFHFARADTKKEKVYLLHSEACVANGNAQDCTYARALERGIIPVLAQWTFDEAVQVSVRNGRLVPV